MEPLESRHLLSVDPVLLAEIPAEYARSSEPEELLDVNGVVFFSAKTAEFGRELWKSDGTDEGTTLVKDIRPGQYSSEPEELINVGGTLFFTADDGVHNRELWRSDGTPEGTWLVKDLWAGSEPAPGFADGPVPMIADGATLYFAADATDGGISRGDLWKTDGTEAGTTKVIDTAISPTAIGNETVINFNGTVYFSQAGNIHRTDGTSSGTVPITNLAPNLFPRSFTEFDGKLIFWAGTSLWATSGGIGEEVVIQDFPGIRSLVPTVVDDSLFIQTYARDSGVSNYKLWKSDGTPESASLVKDFGTSYVFSMTALGDKLVFSSNAEQGTEPWVSDGTPEGTVLLKDILPGSENSAPSEFTAFDDRLFFSAEGPLGRELWTTDGTHSGTVLFKDFRPGEYDSSPADLVVSGETLFFAIRTPLTGRELWKSDGSLAGTELVRDVGIYPRGDAHPRRFTQVGPYIYFIADSLEGGVELWRSDGTPLGATRVADLRPGEEGSDPFWLTEYNGELVFGADDGTTGLEPWRTDGTEAGTVQIKDINPLGSSLYHEYIYSYVVKWENSVGPFKEFQGQLFFAADDGAHGLELWKTDGTEEGTFLFKDIDTSLEYSNSFPGAVYAGDIGFVESDDTLFFLAQDETSRQELWKTDGTEEGTTIVKDIVPDNGLSFSGQLTDVDGTLFFVINDGIHGNELWKSDGTEAGTVLVKDINPGEGSSEPYRLTVMNNTLFFFADDGEGGPGLWKSDGTEAGTVFLKDIAPYRSNYDNGQRMAVSDGTLFFAGDNELNGKELWKSDGTAAGTVLVADIFPDDVSSYPREITPIDGGVAFTVEADGAEGGPRELWVSNGTEDGTYRASHLELAGNPYPSLAYFDSKLYFSANDGNVGQQPWVLPLGFAPEADAGGPYTVDQGATLVLSGSDSVGEAGVFEWDLDNDGQFDDATEVNPSFPTDTAGVFTIGLRITGVDGPTYTTTVTVIPEAAEIGGQYFGEQGTQVALSAAASVGGLFEWDLDNDGQFDDAVGEDVLFDAVNGGVFTIGLRVNGPGGPTDSTTVTVDPELAEINGPYFADQGTVIALSAAGSVGGLFEWDLDDDGQFDDANGLNVSFDAVTAGVLPIALRVNGPGGPIDTTTITVAPESAEIGGPYFGESGTQIALSAAGSVGGLFEWDLDNDGQFDDATGLSATFDAVTDGVFIIGFRVNGPGGSTDTTTVTVEDAIAVIGGPYSGDQGTLIALNAAASSGTLFEWDLDNDGQFDDATGVNLIFNATTGGVFPISLRVNGPTGPIDTTTVTVFPQVADIGGPYAGDEGTVIALDASASVGGLFEWDLDNDGQYDDATGTTAVFNGVTAGVFTIGFRVNGPGGPIDTTTVTVIPEAADIGGPYTGDEATLIPLSAAGSVGSLFEWDLDNDGQYDDATGVNANFAAIERGVYTIGLRVNGPDGPTDSTTVTVTNAPPTASISGTTDIYRGETVTFTLNATDPFPAEQAGLFTFEIDWDCNGTIDETVADVPTGTTVQHRYAAVTEHSIQVRATDQAGFTGGFSGTPITVRPFVVRSDGQGKNDLIWGGTPGLDAVYIVGTSPTMLFITQFENLALVNRVEFVGAPITGKIILHGYEFADALIGELATGNVLEIHGGDGDDVIVGGHRGDLLFGDAGNDVILGGTGPIDGNDLIFGGEGKDTLFGHYGADTLDGGGGEDLLISDRFAFSDTPQDIQRIANEWKSARPYSERMSNILGITSTGVNGPSVLIANTTIADDGAEDTLLGGLGDLDWFFYDFDQDLLGDTIEVGEEETDSNP